MNINEFRIFKGLYNSESIFQLIYERSCFKVLETITHVNEKWNI